MKTKNIFYKVVSSRYKLSPLVFKEYNKKACGVDRANNLASTYRNTYQRTRQWWGSIFNHFLMVSITNSYLIYRDNKLKEINKKIKDLIKKNRKILLIMTRKNFTLKIIAELMYSMGNLPNKYIIDYFKNQKVVIMNPKQKYERDIPHLLLRIQNYRERDKHICFVCKVITTYRCEDCSDETRNTNFCVLCFENFHKKYFTIRSDRRKIE